MKMISDGLLRDRVKKGWIAEDFAKYGETSVENLMDILHRNFPKKFVSFIKREMEKNEKMRKRREKKEPLSQQHEADEKSDGQILEKLLAKEKNLKTNLINKEIQCKTLITQQKAHYEKLREQKDFLQEIYRRIEERSQIVEEEINQLAQLKEQLNVEKASRTQLGQELEKVRGEIKALEEVVIYCYQDGRVELDGEEFGEKDWSEKFYDLISDKMISKDVRFVQVRELTGDMSVKQVKQIAKVFALAERLEQQERKFKFQFDKKGDVSTCLELVNFKVVY